MVSEIKNNYHISLARVSLLMLGYTYNDIGFMCTQRRGYTYQQIREKIAPYMERIGLKASDGVMNLYNKESGVTHSFCDYKALLDSSGLVGNTVDNPAKLMDAGEKLINLAVKVNPQIKSDKIRLMAEFRKKPRKTMGSLGLFFKTNRDGSRMWIHAEAWEIFSKILC